MKLGLPSWVLPRALGNELCRSSTPLTSISVFTPARFGNGFFLAESDANTLLPPLTLLCYLVSTRSGGARATNPGAAALRPRPPPFYFAFGFLVWMLPPLL